MGYLINRVVVIGSGTMGGGIAAHVANAGLPVYLLDIAPTELSPQEEKRGLTLEHPAVRNRIVSASLDRLKKSKPLSFFTPQTADLVTIGNLSDNFSWVAEGDWIVEAIVENLQAKRELVARIEQVRNPSSIVSSNTSGLPIGAIAATASVPPKVYATPRLPMPDKVAQPESVVKTLFNSLNEKQKEAATNTSWR